MLKTKLYIVERVLVEWECPHCGIANGSKTWKSLLPQITTMKCRNCLEEVEMEMINHNTGTYHGIQAEKDILQDIIEVVNKKLDNILDNINKLK